MDGGGVSELGRRIGKSEEYVSHRMQLLKLPEEVREKITNHILGVSQALELTDSKLGPQTQELAQEIIDNKMTVKQIRQLKSEMRSAEPFDYSGMAPASDGSPASIHAESERRRRAAAAAKRESVIIKRSVLALRIAMSRLDELVEDANKGNPRGKVDLIQFLMDMRPQAHGMIDDTLRYKREHCADRD